MKEFLKWLWSKIKVKDVIYPIIIFLLIAALSFSVDRCSQIQHEYKNNIKALTDTISYLHDKNGNEYIGEYSNGLFNGEGMYKWNENEYYKQ